MIEQLEQVQRVDTMQLRMAAGPQAGRLTVYQALAETSLTDTLSPNFSHSTARPTKSAAVEATAYQTGQGRDSHWDEDFEGHVNAGEETETDEDD